MKNEAETNPSPITLAGNSVPVQPHPAVEAIVKTHHEQTDTDKLVRDIQEAGSVGAKAEGASVAPIIEPSPAIFKTIKDKIEQAEKSKLSTSKPDKWKTIWDLMRSGRQRLEQLRAA